MTYVILVIKFNKNFSKGMKFMYNSTVAAMKTIFSGEYNHDNPLLTFKDYQNRGMFLAYNKQDLIIQQGASVKYIYFLLKGTASVLNSISWTNSDIIDTLVPLDLLGLVELLNEQKAYTGYVVAETPCVVFRVSTDLFLSIIKSDGLLCYETLRILGKITEHNMNRAETNAIFHPSDRLGHFLYLSSHGHVPYIYPHTRKKLAEDLHINLRSLYRYLDSMAEEGFIKLERGKIQITKENFAKLDERYGSIVL